MEKKLKIGFIGTGSIAYSAHFPSVSSFEDCEMAAVLGHSRDKAEKAANNFGIKYVANDLNDFLEQDLDAVFLLTPKMIRSEYLVPLINAGVDIFVEKPLATTLSECDYLANVSASSNQLVMVGFNRRYSPVNEAGIREFGEKKPHFVLAKKCREFKEYRGTLENAIHMVDMLRYVLGECVDVQSKAKWSNPFYEDLCIAQMEFENGSLAQLAASREAGQWYERIEMFGDNRTVIMESPDQLTVVRKEYDEVRKMTPLMKGWSNYLDTIGFRPCDRHFIDCVKSRCKPLTCAEDAIKTHFLMDRILRSAGLPDLSKEWER